MLVSNIDNNNKITIIIITIIMMMMMIIIDELSLTVLLSAVVPADSVS